MLGSNSSGSIVTTSFWDIEISGCATSAGGSGLTTAEMQTVSTFLEAGWDFVMKPRTEPKTYGGLTKAKTIRGYGGN